MVTTPAIFLCMFPFLVYADISAFYMPSMISIVFIYECIYVCVLICDFIYYVFLLFCFRASFMGHADVVEYFIEEGAEATLSPETQETALHESVRAGHTNIVELLLQKLPALLSLDDHPGYNSFHIAAKHGHAKVMEFLLRIADENEQQHDVLQVPTIAMHGGRVVFRQESSRNGGSINPSLPDISINPYMQSVDQLRTPLHEAASHGHLEVVKIYLEYIKAHPLSSNSSTDITEDPAATPTVSYTASPMHFPSRQLLVHPAVDMLTLLGRTAFHEATKINNFEIMEALLDAGADINAVMRPYLDRTANADLTALVTACMANDVNTVRFLLRHGATDARGKALGRSIKFKKDEVIGLILAFNNNIVATSEDHNVLPSDMSAHYDDKILLDLNWNSKGLPYLNEQWLKMAVTESPHPQAEFCAISEIDVSSNSLLEVPLALFQLENLLSMDLSRNKISALPLDENGCGWNCPLLRSVDLHNNKITELPDCLFRLPKLKELTAGENLLVHIPIEMWSAPKLKHLRLGRNQILELPSKPINVMFNSPELMPQTPSEPSPADVNIVPYDASSEVIASPDFKSSPQHVDNSFSNVSFVFTSSMYMSTSQVATPEPKPSWRKQSATTSHNRLLSSRRAVFQGLLHGDEDELETLHYNPEEDTSVLEILDVSCNKLTKFPFGLSCLAPKLKKLNLSGNQIENLGHVIDYPSELEVLDACSNDAISAIAFDASYKERASYIPFMRGFCPRKLLTNDSIPPKSKPCGHWYHKTLSKLSTLKLNSNKLVELELFRVVTKRKSCELTDEDRSGSDLTLKREPGDSTHSSSSSSGHGSMRDMSVTSQRHIDILSKSTSSPTFKNFVIGNTDNTSGTSSNIANNEESSVKESTIPVAIFPELASLEIADNRLKSVPPYLYLCSHLASLNISHNFNITTLPLELSNLEHLWNLEYDDVPLVNPPAEDLDKYRIASDKLQYMRSLLHQ